MSTARLRIGVSNNPTARLRIAVVPDSIDPPTNAYGAHIGSGNVLVTFTEPDADNLDYYEVLVSESVSGDYVIVGRNKFTAAPILMNNIPLGVTAFIRLRAVSQGGAESTWTQVKRAIFHKPATMMRCIAPSGSVIPEGARFACQSRERDRLIAFEANEEVVFVD
jgi:hypothetical protein